MFSIKELFGVLLWIGIFIPMIILNEVLPGHFFRSGSALYYLSFLAWPVIAYVSLTTFCVKDRQFIIIRTIGFIAVEIALICVVIYGAR